MASAGGAAGVEGGAAGIGGGSAAGSGGSAGAAEPGSMVCVVGARRSCLGEARCQGEQVCLDSGAAFSTCECVSQVQFLDPATGRSVQAASAEGVIGEEEEAEPQPAEEALEPPPPSVGAACSTDADCVAGLTCLTAEGDGYFSLGGPAGGYCTMPCTELEQCRAVDAQASCWLDAAICVRDCFSKNPEPGEAKCFDRSDVVCHSFAASGAEPFTTARQGGYCRPLCGSDADCPGNRICHPRVGFCVELELEPKGEIGDACSVDEDCQSNLCDIVGPLGVCSQLCVLGQVGGCGYAASDSERPAACLNAFVQQSRFAEGIGDLGMCREVCDVDADCRQVDAGWACRPLSAGAADFFGRPGACMPTEAAL